MSDSPQRILIQLDAGPHVSSFDSIVAIDSGSDQVLPFHNVEPAGVRDIVHGAMFTRGGENLKNTAIFVGGSNVAQGEALFEQVNQTFFGPMRVSVMLDPNGANTTSVAAVLSAAKHLELKGQTAVVFAGTGPVGQRVSRLLSRAGARVRVGSRSIDRATAVCQRIAAQLDGDAEANEPTPVQIARGDEAATALEGAGLAVCAGAAGVSLVAHEIWTAADSLRVIIDLNAVPPAGAEGVQVTDKAADRDGKITYGAIGVGGLKMKIHRAAIRQLFSANDLVLDAEQIMELAGGALSP